VNARTHSRSGFTIVEVVLAMGLLLLGMTSVLGLLSFGAALARTAALRTAAAGAAEAVAADLEETLFPLSLDPATGERLVGEPHAIVDREVTGHAGLVYSATATPVPASDDELGVGQAGRPAGAPQRYKVEVRMRWTTAGAGRERRFTLLLLREVPFGERLRREFVERDLDPLGSRAQPPGQAPEPARP
jgi:hypothetical protein